MRTSAEIMMEEGKTTGHEADDRFATEIRERSDYDSALETFRRFREMVGTPRPSRVVPKTTRGTWVKTDTEVVGWRPRS